MESVSVKASLEYILPEENYEYRIAANAHELASAINDTNETIRQWRKHGGKTAEELVNEISEDLAPAMQIILP